MNLIYSVGKGSNSEPCIVNLYYNGITYNFNTYIKRLNNFNINYLVVYIKYNKHNIKQVIHKVMMLLHL